MKNSFYLSITVLSATLAGCINIGTSGLMSQGSPIKSSFPLFHQYNVQSLDDNPNSKYGVLRRSTEIEYRLTDDATQPLEISVMITTGYKEGTIKSSLLLNFEDDTELELIATDLVTREYVENSQFTNSTPIQKTKMVHDPGGIDIVNNSDGSVSHVTRPATSKQVSYTENQTSTSNYKKSQLFNKATYQVSQESVSEMKTGQIIEIELMTKSGRLVLALSKLQRKQLSKVLATL